MFWLSEKNRARVGKIVKVEEKYANVHLSTSSKKQSGEGYEYSNWSFATFVGKARASLELIGEGDIITITQGFVSNVPYEKDGEKHWNNLKVVILDFEVYRKKDGAATATPIAATVPSDDDIPF